MRDGGREGKFWLLYMYVYIGTNKTNHLNGFAEHRDGFPIEKFSLKL